MIEAICVGLPIVTTKVSGTAELVKDGVNGIVVEIGDANSLAMAMNTLLKDEKLQLMMSENSKKMNRAFSLDVIVNEWMALVEQVVR